MKDTINNLNAVINFAKRKIPDYNPEDHKKPENYVMHTGSVRIDKGFDFNEPSNIKKKARRGYTIQDGVIVKTRISPAPVVITPKKLQVIHRDNGICQLCLLPVPNNEVSIDHILPQSKGGSCDMNNLQLAHSYCNSYKSNRTDFISPEEYRSYYLSKTEQRIYLVR